jgi:HK97 family phage major capsid protein/HK97 family phage prohead protease
VLTNRAYSLLDIKAIDEDERIVTGIASTAEPDRMGDIVEPKGAEFKLPIPFLWQHNAREPIGEVFAAKVTKNGIEIKARIAKITEPGALKDRIDEAWQSLKAGLVKGLSIGFQPIESARIDNTYGLRFIKWLWLELSAVTIAANGGAFVSSIKSIADLDRAALGTGPVGVTSTSAGVSAPVVKASKGAGTTMAKTIQEQITNFEATRQAKAARMTAIMTTSGENGETLNEADSQEYDGLSTEIKSIDAHLKRLAELETANLVEAKSVSNVTTIAAASAARAGASVVTVKSNLPKGIGFTRYAMALAASRGSRMEAAEYAKRWKDSTPEVAMVLKAAVDAGTTTDATWAAPLVVYNNLASEFIELLRPATIIGRINGFRRVPFNVTMPRQTGGSTVGWVGQGAPKPVGELAFDQVSLGMAKAAGIIVISEELARSSDPSAEAIVSEDLRKAIAQFLDEQFINPSVAAVSNVSPAAVTNGASVIDSTGVTAAHLRADFAAALAVWTAAELSIAGGVIVMTETQAIRLSMLVNAFGQPEFPGLTATGGTLFGLPVIASENVPAEGGSPAGNRIVLLKPGEILLADDGGIMLDVSREASVQMNSTPTNPADASTVMVSLWQNNLVGLRAERFINWVKRRTAAAVIIEGAIYTG